MNSVASRLLWVFIRRHLWAHRRRGFHAHFWTYADSGCSFSDGNRLHRSATLYGCSLGVSTYTLGTMIRCRVGHYCSIGRAQVGGQARHPTSFLSTHPAFYSTQTDAGFTFATLDGFDSAARETLVGSDVWIGHGAVVLEGREIGHGAVVAASAVVTRDVPPYAIVAGVPARVVQYRFEQDVIDALLEWRWWELPPDDLRRLVRWLGQPEALTLQRLADLRAAAPWEE